VDILNALGSKKTISSTPAIEIALEKIQAICNQKYSNQSFYGNAALNRLMLLDEEIARHLTPEVLSFIFTNKETAKIFRNSSGQINLWGAIYHGFKDGLHLIHYMPNNEQDYNPVAYQQQQHKFTSNTLQIVKNMLLAAKVEGITEVWDIKPEQKRNPSELIAQYDKIIDTVNCLKENRRSDELLQVPGYSPDQMRSQVQRGFQRLCGMKGIKNPNEGTLDAFCEAFLHNEAAMLDGWVIHLFYDRAHIEAALEQGTTYQFQDNTYNFQDIFRAMIAKIARNPDNYPACAKEQFCLRFGLVESDLKVRFAAAYKTSSSSKELMSTRIDPITNSCSNGLAYYATFQDSLEQLKKSLSDTECDYQKNNLFEGLKRAEEEFLITATPTSSQTLIAKFHQHCKEHIENADKMMGHGSLYRIAEVLIKAVVGLFIGIGMVLGALVGQGLLKAAHRQKFSDTFFTLNQTKASKVLNEFAQTLDNSFTSTNA
ncbi:MAG: hypothetical protein EBY16_07465, partial [Gammaproteobacteria bacterium]|nr:hypothetical protein [Gammaproteobacteria bacterium]